MNPPAHLLRPGARGPALGWGISLLVHAGIIAWLMHAPLPHPAGTAAAPRIDFVLVPLRPPRPPPEAAPAPVPEHAITQARPAPPHRSRPRARASPSARTPASASPVHAPAAERAPQATATDNTAAPGGPDDTARVDITSARQAARLIAREEGKNLVLLPKRKPVVDPTADNVVDDPIERARRSDCRTAYAGLGVFALIPLARDALAGSGCKW